MKKFNTGVEALALVVIALIFVVNIVIGEHDIAIGAVVGGGLFLLDYIAIKFVVKSLTENKYSLLFSIFIVVLKLLALVAIVVVLLVFAKLNIYGLILGLTSLVIIIIGKGLRG